MRLTRAVIYLWALPTTAVGMLLILVASVFARVHLRVVDGVLEASGPSIERFLRDFTLLPGGASAMTLGHIVVGRDQASLDRTRSHERIHVRQCERWGPAFLPAYAAVSMLLFLRGADAYRDNLFEREAYQTAPTPPT